MHDSEYTPPPPSPLLLKTSLVAEPSKAAGEDPNKLIPVEGEAVIPQAHIQHASILSDSRECITATTAAAAAV